MELCLCLGSSLGRRLCSSRLLVCPGSSRPPGGGCLSPSSGRLWRDGLRLSGGGSKDPKERKRSLRSGRGAENVESEPGAFLQAFGGLGVGEIDQKRRD